jgi:enamine deaminase RidA (YjgF/YER057c/UK114 family)
LSFKREDIEPAELYKHPGYKRVTTVEGNMKLVFIAGQTPTDENYKCIAPGDFAAQYLHVMKMLEIQLRAAGATWDDVTYRRIYVRTSDNPTAPSWADQPLPKYGEGAIRPPSTMIGVTRLGHPDFLVEIDLMAAVPASSGD